MQQQADYLHPDLINVEERPDLRRAPRLVPVNLHAELDNKRLGHPTECYCLNVSEQGIALLCDIRDIFVGERVTINIWQDRRHIRKLTGDVVRVEIRHRFTRLAVRFNNQHFTHPVLKPF